MSTSTSTRSSAAMPSKRTRTTPNAERSGTVSRQRTRKRLPSLHEMPFDIFLEILLQIDPKGLINLARSSKDTRRALVNETMDKLLWKQVREESEAVEPPPGWSEAKWVSFLFVSFCYSCGKANATTDFYILKRLCGPCKKAGYIRGSNIDTYDWDEVKGEWYDHEEASLHTPYPGTARKGEDTHNYYWSNDLKECCTLWNALCKDVTKGVANSLEALQRFQKERKEYARVVRENAPEMLEWEADLQAKRKQDLESNKGNLVAGIRKRFIELGAYKPEDVERAINMKTTGICGSAATEVTNRTWKTWRTKLEPMVKKVTDARVKNTRLARMAKILSYWGSWRASLSLPTIEILAYPAPRDIWYLPEVTAIREADPDLTFGPESYKPIIDAFPTIASTFVSNRKDELLRMIPCASGGPQAHDPFELVTSVFRAPKGPDVKSFTDDAFSIGSVCVVGWKGLSVSHCTVLDPQVKDDMPTPGRRSVLPVFDTRISGVAHSLVVLCGLNPETATPDDMDRMDERFVCCACAQQVFAHVDSATLGDLAVVEEGSPASICLEVHDWRTAVYHARTCGDNRLGLLQWLGPPFDMNTPTFRKLGDVPLPSGRALVDEQERKDCSDKLISRAVRYSCNHCLATLRVWTVSIVLSHLKEEHKIDEPISETDYFADPVRSEWQDPCSLFVRIPSTTG